MIFNPLFINDNGNNQMLVSKPGKLSNNKYLFSDIVKVIMNPGESQKLSAKNNLENIVENKIKLSLNGDQKPVRLKFKFLSDTDNEQAKLDLADMLPEEIAHLLINNDALPSEEKAVSYISKEPLKGELQSFLYELIGPEIIEKHLNDNSGLLLSMEDQKSAVNLELVKDADEKETNDKIIVQTLVVPEKSKLLSLIGDSNNNETFFKLNNTSNVALDSNTKPSLSVYSFKYGDEKFESLTKSLKASFSPKVDLEKNLNESLTDLNSKIQKVPLEKISFIPSELKKQSIETIKGIYNQSKAIEQSAADLRLYKLNGEFTEKDFSVSKITIFKKQDIDSKLEIKSENNNTTKLNTDDISKIKLNTGPALHVMAKQISKQSDEITANIDKPKTNDQELKIVSNDLKTFTASLKKESIADVNNKSISTKENVDSEKISKNVKSVDLSKSSEKAELKNEALNSKEIKDTKAPKIFNHMTLKTENVKYEKSVNTDSEKSKPIAKVSDDKITGSDKKVDPNKIEQKSDFTTKSEIKNEKNIGEIKFSNSNKFSENNEIKVKVNSQNESLNGLRKIADNKNEFVKKEEIGVIKNKETVESKNISESKTKNINESKNNNDELQFIKSKFEPKIDISKVSEKVQNISNKINYENLKNEEVKLENKQDIGLDKKINNFESKISELQNTSKQNENVDQRSKFSESNNVNKEKAEQPIKTNDQQISKVEQNQNEDKKAVESSNYSSSKKEIISNDTKVIEKSDQKEIKDTAEIIQKAAVNTVAVNSNETEIKENNTNKKISIKVRGEIKSVTDKNETKNIAVDEKTSTNKQNNSDTSEQNANTALKNSTISQNHTEVKSSSDNVFNNTLNKEINIASQFNAHKTEEFENPGSQRIVKSVEVIKEITKFISKQEKGTLSLEIKPEHLGRMKITLDTADNVLKARIEVDNEQSKQLVEKNLDKLHHQLGENGIQLNSLNISLGNPKHRYEQETVNQQSSQRREENFENNEEQKKEQKKKSLGYNTYEYIA